MAVAAREEPIAREYYCWAPDAEYGTERTQWYVRDAADNSVIAGPFDIDDAIRESARRNKEIGIA